MCNADFGKDSVARYALIDGRARPLPLFALAAAPALSHHTGSARAVLQVGDREKSEQKMVNLLLDRSKIIFTPSWLVDSAKVVFLLKKKRGWWGGEASLFTRKRKKKRKKNRY